MSITCQGALWRDSVASYQGYFLKERMVTHCLVERMTVISTSIFYNNDHLNLRPLQSIYSWENGNVSTRNWWLWVINTHTSVPGSTENKQDGHCQQKSRCHRNQDATFSWNYNICIFSIVSDSDFDVLRCVTINSIIQICKIKKETVIWVMSTFIFFELETFSPKSEMYVYPYLCMHDYSRKFLFHA